jgi:hypothetical protein
MLIVSFVGISAAYKNAHEIPAEAVGKEGTREQSGLAGTPGELRTAYRIRSNASELVSRREERP